MNKIKTLWSNLQASLWFVPGVMIFSAIVLALALIEIDSHIKSEWLAAYPRIFGLGADGSRGMLTAIASSMLTVATLAFSLTLNSITQASGQYTPRIFRNFMRDRANQFVLGYFVSVFVYCLLVLRTIRGGDEIKFVPSFAVMVGLLSAIGGVFVLIFFIHHIASSLQITTILDNITDETKAVIDRLFPEDFGKPATNDEKQQAWRASEAQAWTKISATEPGYIQNIDTDGLLAFAAENNLLIRLRRGIGQFAGTGATLAEITSDTDSENGQADISQLDPADIAAFFGINRFRTIEQDAGFGIRQIVDIALKALSPGINDTTTAVNCIDQLGEIVGTIARRKLPVKIRADKDVARIMIVAPDFRDYVESAFDQIRISGGANQAIFERLLTTLCFIGECTNETGRRTIIQNQIDLVGKSAEATLKTEHEKEKVRLKFREAKIFNRILE